MISQPFHLSFRKQFYFHTISISNHSLPTIFLENSCIYMKVESPLKGYLHLNSTAFSFQGKRALFPDTGDARISHRALIRIWSLLPLKTCRQLLVRAVGDLLHQLQTLLHLWMDSLVITSEKCILISQNATLLMVNPPPQGKLLLKVNPWPTFIDIFIIQLQFAFWNGLFL